MGMIPHRDIQGYWTKLHPTCFASPILNIFIPSGDICRQILKSTEIGPNFACLSPLKFFGRHPQNFGPGL